EKGGGGEEGEAGERARRKEGRGKGGEPPVMRSRKMPVAREGASNGEMGGEDTRCGIRQTGTSLRPSRAPVMEDATVVGWPEHWARSAEAASSVPEPDRAPLPARQIGPPLRRIEASARLAEPS